MKQKKKILFVAMQMSIHSARWINQLAESDYDVHLFPVNYLPVHHELRNITVHRPFYIFSPRRSLLDLTKKLVRWLSGRSSATNLTTSPAQVRYQAVYALPVLGRMMPYLNYAKRTQLGVADASVPAIFGPRVLVRLIKRLAPDLIHSLEFQHCSYLVLSARDRVGSNFPNWWITNWGSDIYYYRQFPDHREQISRLLKFADIYSCECSRDVALAKELGFSGKVMPVMPNTGGIDLRQAELIRSLRLTSHRRIIMVKGYQHFAGRALTALDAIEMSIDTVRDYKIVIFSASPEVYGRVDELRTCYGLDVMMLGHVSHDHMLRMFARARIYLGVSISDAISTSLLEAMAGGAFPIQTSTSCCNEWVEDGVTGYIVPVDDVASISARLCDAVLNDTLVDNAAELNWLTVQKRLDKELLRQKALGFYEDVFRDSYECSR